MALSVSSSIVTRAMLGGGGSLPRKTKRKSYVLSSNNWKRDVVLRPQARPAETSAVAAARARFRSLRWMARRETFAEDERDPEPAVSGFRDEIGVLKSVPIGVRRSSWISSQRR